MQLTEYYRSYDLPWELDPEQPRLRPGWLRGFRHYVNLHRTADRLRCLARSPRCR